MKAHSKQEHAAHAVEARRRYLEARDPVEAAKDWAFALSQARRILVKALRASDHLDKVSVALQCSGEHMYAFRQFTAPPISQDQFKLLCPSWPKQSEKTGRPVAAKSAAEVEAIFNIWRDRNLTRWLDENRGPTKNEIRRILSNIAPVIAMQSLATSRRNRLALHQESAVIEMLEAKGWLRLPSSLIDTRAAVPERYFQHKTRFATITTSQEVDIACGLPGTVVLAMECKVTNDETNSIKRINDILKKAEAWKTHWGSFVVTAALLDGVIAAKEVSRLIDHGVQVFWSHDLDAFDDWLESRF